MASKKLWFFTVLLVLTAGTAAAQDARTVLQAAARALGAENLRCVTYSGSGFAGLVGQQYDLRDDWPRVDLMAYSRTINYDAKSSENFPRPIRGRPPATPSAHPGPPRSRLSTPAKR